MLALSNYEAADGAWMRNTGMEAEDPTDRVLALSAGIFWITHAHVKRNQILQSATL